MARGRLLKSKIKEAKAIAEAIGKGIAKANEKKPLKESLKEHLGRMVDRLDPLEAAAIIGMTLLIKPILSASVKTGTTIWEWTALIGSPLGLAIVTLFPDLKEAFEKGIEKAEGDLHAQVIEWLIAFALAFFIVRHGADLSGGLSKAVLGIVGA